MPRVAQATTSPIKRTSPPSLVPADIRAMPAYRALTPKGRADLEAIVRLANRRRDGAEFLAGIRTVLSTPFVKQSVEAQNRAELQHAVAALGAPAADADAEERASADPSRKWTRLGPKPGGASSLRISGVNTAPRYFDVDRSDPNRIVVRIKVRLNGPLAPDVAKLEDAIEKHLRRENFIVDLQLVDRPGPDVFDVNTDPAVWPNAENWVAGPTTLAHELMHLLEVNDEYDYRSHASNSAMSMNERLYWLKVEAGRPPPPADAWQGIMTGGRNPVLDRHVREVARLPLSAEAREELRRARLSILKP